MEWLIYIFIIRLTNTAVLKGQSAPAYGDHDRSPPLFTHIQIASRKVQHVHMKDIFNVNAGQS